MTWAGIQPQAHLASDSSTYVQELDAKGETFRGTTVSWGHTAQPAHPGPQLCPPDPCSTASLASRLWPHPAKSTHTKGSALAGPPSRMLLPAPAPRQTPPAPRFHSTTPSPQSLHRTSYLKWSFCPTPPPWLSNKSSSFSGPPSKASCFSVV